MNSVLQHGRVDDKNYCVGSISYFRFPYLTLCPRQCKWKVAATYLAKEAKKN